jgi:hypothetical protein
MAEDISRIPKVAVCGEVYTPVTEMEWRTIYNSMDASNRHMHKEGILHRLGYAVFSCDGNLVVTDRYRNPERFRQEILWEIVADRDFMKASVVA